MCLPKRRGKIDIEQTKQMVDLFMEVGLTYFDTAYVYDGGDSERAAKAALVDRYPRESYTLAARSRFQFLRFLLRETSSLTPLRI